MLGWFRSDVPVFIKFYKFFYNIHILKLLQDNLILLIFFNEHDDSLSVIIIYCQ